MIAHPKGGVVAESWVLSCFFGFVFFVWFRFCLAIAEKPSRNCQWLQSSERTIADAVVAKMCSVSGCRMQWKTKTALPGCPLLLIYTHKCHWPAKHQHWHQMQSDSLWWCHRWHTENVEKEFCILHATGHAIKSLQDLQPWSHPLNFGLSAIANCIDNEQNWQDTFTAMGPKKRVQLHMQTDWNVMSLHAKKKTYFSFMILSTIAKNMPLNMLSTKPEFEINHLRHSQCDRQASTSLQDLRCRAYQLAMQVPTQQQLGKDISSQDCSFFLFADCIQWRVEFWTQ